MNLILILLGKIVLFLSKRLKLGAGSTWPGHVAMETNPRFLKEILAKNKHLKIILVAGTNGKTTTSKMLKEILEKAGLRVFQNAEGANLLNGMASSVITNSNIFGKLNCDYAIFETDENNLKLALQEFSPDIILLLNIFRDQLDRYGEVNKVADDWKEALSNLKAKSILVTNGDDPELTHIAQVSGLKSYFFGINDEDMKKRELGHDTDFNYCPKCGTELTYSKISYSHLGIFECKNCNFNHPKIDFVENLLYPLFGKYNVYNTNAAAVLAKNALAIETKTINSALKDFLPAFGRQERIIYHGKEVVMLLSKNPAGFNQSIESIKNKKGTALLLLNDRVPDGRDVSWIWDVDFENLSGKKVFISGDRAYDMALRIKYADIKKFETIENLTAAINKSSTITRDTETLFILPTYSAMLDAREIMTGKKIL